MSIVACKVHDDKIVVGSDSILVRGWTKDKFAKLQEVNDLVIGGVGLAEDIALLMLFCSTRRPALPANQTTMLNFWVEFLDWRKGRLDKYGMDTAEFIIIFGKKVFRIHGLFIMEIEDFDAIGAGMEYALTALHLDKDIPEAIEIACELSVYCERPVKVIEVPR